MLGQPVSMLIRWSWREAYRTPAVKALRHRSGADHHRDAAASMVSSAICRVFRPGLQDLPLAESRDHRQHALSMGRPAAFSRSIKESLRLPETHRRSDEPDVGHPPKKIIFWNTTMYVQSVQ